jgi:hypothetical protein
VLNGVDYVMITLETDPTTVGGGGSLQRKAAGHDGYSQLGKKVVDRQRAARAHTRGKGSAGPSRPLPSFRSSSRRAAVNAKACRE